MKHFLKLVLICAIIIAVCLALSKYYIHFHNIAIHVSWISVLSLGLMSLVHLVIYIVRQFRKDINFSFKGYILIFLAIIISFLFVTFFDFYKVKYKKGEITEVSLYCNNEDTVLWIEVKVGSGGKIKKDDYRTKIINLTHPQKPVLVSDIDNPYPWRFSSGSIFSERLLTFLKQSKDTLWFWSPFRGIHTRNLYKGDVIAQELEKEKSKEIVINGDTIKYEMLIKKTEYGQMSMLEEPQYKHQVATLWGIARGASPQPLFIYLSQDGYKENNKPPFSLLQIFNGKPLSNDSLFFTIKKEDNYKLVCTSNNTVVWKWNDEDDILKETRGGYIYKNMLIVFTNRHLICLNLNNGSLQWNYKI